MRRGGIVVGLDCATKTGWCVLGKDGRPIESGVQDFSKRRGESNGLMFLRFRRWLMDTLSSLPEKPTLVVYERAHFRGGAATEIGVGLQTRVQEVCAEMEIESSPVHTTQLKKYATGKGNAGKNLVMETVVPILGRQPIDDNEADSVIAAKWGREEYVEV